VQGEQGQLEALRNESLRRWERRAARAGAAVAADAPAAGEDAGAGFSGRDSGEISRFADVGYEHLLRVRLWRQAALLWDEMARAMSLLRGIGCGCRPGDGGLRRLDRADDSAGLALLKFIAIENPHPREAIEELRRNRHYCEGAGASGGRWICAGGKGV